jgi:site-specific DNA-methyltransferase (adenine-specific)
MNMVDRLKLPINKIIQGNALEVLKTLPDECVDMVVTSPPYWQIRTYEIPLQVWSDGWNGELGLEPYFYQYIDHLCDIFDEIKRVLKETGSIWVNLGDTYAGSNNGSNDRREKTGMGTKPADRYKGQKAGRAENLPPKSLCQIPNRFAIEMTNRGWILRNELIWWKPNGLPNPVKDRFPVDFEKIFFFARSKKYFFERQFEPHSNEELESGIQGAKKYGYDGKGSYADWYFNKRKKHSWVGKVDTLVKGFGQGTRGQHKPKLLHPFGRSKRAVWRVPTKPFGESHFATYPPDLIRTPILAGCPELVCRKCGKPTEKIIGSEGNGERPKASGLDRWVNCNCWAGYESGIVLDPFMGSGTTAIVARQLGRRFIGIELKPDYLSMSQDRLNNCKK